MRGLPCKVVGKVTRAKEWKVVSDTGESHLENFNQNSIKQKSGLTTRDLRILDPTLSYSCIILARESAILVNLEYIKAIIMAKEVLAINSSNPFFLSFLQDLQARLSSSNNVAPSEMSNNMNNDREEKALLKESHSLRNRSDSPNNLTKEIFEDSFQDTPTPAPKQLSFEFKVLNACIESACTCLEYETQTLEEEAYPALDELISPNRRLKLERVRQIKNRLVALFGRVQKVADQLEYLLDDDNDLTEMYLTQKLDACSAFEDDDQSYKSNSDEVESSGAEPNVQEFEMLLEANFAQIKGILQKLTNLGEYVEDTKDYINLTSAEKQNKLLQASVTLNTLNLILNAGIVVVGLFGMNIHIKLFDGQPHQFWATSFGTVGGCIVIFLFSLWWGKKKYLLF